MLYLYINTAILSRLIFKYHACGIVFKNCYAEEVGLEPTNPVKGSTFQEWCNSRYATPPKKLPSLQIWPRLNPWH